MRVFHEDFTRSGESVVFIHSKVMALVMENEQVLKDGFDTVICHAQTTDTKILNKKTGAACTRAGRLREYCSSIIIIINEWDEDPPPPHCSR